MKKAYIVSLGIVKWWAIGTAGMLLVLGGGGS